MKLTPIKRTLADSASLVVQTPWETRWEPWVPLEVKQNAFSQHSK